ncbi:Branched-chain amino acid ABC transporter, permease protein [Alloalcanivorax dieselolei B5]|uniref:Branched-chain amino acid ABC transporter, permease protein n=1 Tax=Alcanivorax dieselolei (strain DSM 16502 / CGMCC 1.3690 / MCCC 1A00001 / B-5) TaxID=930169 RepID=K0CCD3_ALCDB|nr:branched-chain amino acid ABC transporter permease [Alloalcanivorax dieselolei]AFT70165.1 Branched-chain amino acid ABC transporter, permease protein [Alloalcanivorax dieselolei B5]GGJ95917.1 branched-chain amino acid ABC transporter permease [Alloalcanivorax dieselolei]
MSAPQDIFDADTGNRSWWERLRGFQQDKPHLFLLLIMVVIPLFLMNPSTWAVLTLSGLAMGAMLFLMASGMTLTFGLMNVLNLAHGSFISLGAFAGATVLTMWLNDYTSGSLWVNLLAVIPALLFALVVAGLLGVLFERLVIRPVYGDHLKQILVTVGGSIIVMELLQVIWGSNEIPVPRPEALRGALLISDAIPIIGGIALEKYRLLAVVLGLAVYALMLWVIDRTRLGILIRAGVENREMVEVHGYRIRLLFLAVFVAGSALAGIGGAMWAMYREIITAHMGEELMISVIVVIILGGLGSVRGCFYGAMLVGLINLYVGFLEPRLAAVATVGLMVAVLMWRPQGLIPVIKV